MEKYSVLMSVYFRENPTFLFQSLASIFAQSAPPDEVVLVKDGQLNPGLDAVIQQFQHQQPTLQIVHLAKNGGLGKALNEGLQHCSHDLVGRMDSDDLATRDRFEKQLAVFSQHPELVVVGTWVAEFESDSRIVSGERRVPVSDREIKAMFASKCPVNHPSIMFRKAAVIAVGGYLGKYLQEDYYLWGRLIKGGANFYNIPESLVLMRAPIDLFSRRGGWSYAVSELKLQREFVRLGLFGELTFLRNAIVRFIIRIAPNRLRKLLYRTFLRG